MAHIVINALSMRRGGGLQVIAGLATRLSAKHRYSILCVDPRSLVQFKAIIGTRDHIQFVDPIGNASNVVAYLWSMTRLAHWASAKNAECVVNVNHHYPSRQVPQVVYHLSVLRFERDRKSIFNLGELSDRLRDGRAHAALRCADVNIFESETIRNLAERVASKPINAPTVMYIGLDDRIKPFARSITLLDRSNLLVITSAEPHKDNETLVNMLAILVDKKPEVNWRLLIAGGTDIEQFSGLKALALAKGVEDRVQFLGFVSHEKLAAIGRSSLCMVSASLAESFAMAALEAMSWGCPPIVANCSGMPESIGHAGLLAQPGDPVDFASQVLAIYDDDTLRDALVRKGLERAEAMTWTNAACQFEKTIEQLIEKRQIQTG